MNRNSGFLAFLALLLSSLLPSVPLAAAPSTAAAPSSSPQPADRAELEKQFAQTLTHATLEGSYNLDKDPKKTMDEKHEIIKAVKATGDEWTLTARIGHFGIGVPVEITVPVRWAGDTPVIEVTDMKIPLLGTFTARVMFFHDHYCGIWSGVGHGGMMWGQITHPAAGAPATMPAQ